MPRAFNTFMGAPTLPQGPRLNIKIPNAKNVKGLTGNISSASLPGTPVAMNRTPVENKWPQVKTKYLPRTRRRRNLRRKTRRNSRSHRNRR